MFSLYLFLCIISAVVVLIFHIWLDQYKDTTNTNIYNNEPKDIIKYYKFINADLVLWFYAFFILGCLIPVYFINAYKIYKILQKNKIANACVYYNLINEINIKPLNLFLKNKKQFVNKPADKNLKDFLVMLDKED